MLIYLNDALVPKSEAKVSVFDHGFLYGDGIYETMRAYDGVIFMLDEHLIRLYRSASKIGLDVPKSIDEIKAALYDTLKANSLRNAYVRLTISRGYGPIGLDPDLCKEPTFIIIAEEMKDYPKSYYARGIKIIIAGTKRNLKDAINPQIKSLNFLNNILAKIEAKERNAYEALMLNFSEHLAEGTISNVFFYKEDILCTPSIDCGILDGITRKIVIDLAVREGLRVREGLFARDDIYSAGEVFITNSTMEVMPVSQVDDARYKVGGIAKLLHKAYRDEVIAYVKNAKESGPSLWGYE
jgi:branched-chain amino acid aminotransferase